MHCRDGLAKMSMGRELLGREGLRMQKRKRGRGVPITWEGDPEHRWVTQWSGFDQEKGLLHSPKGGGWCCLGTLGRHNGKGLRVLSWSKGLFLVLGFLLYSGYF